MVRVEKDDGATILGLLRLADQPWNEMDHGSLAPIKAILKRKRRDWLPGAHAPIGAFLLLVGMAIGFMIWRPQGSANSHPGREPRASSPVSGSAAAASDFQRLLPRLPRSVQSQFRQIETQAMSPGPLGAWQRTRDEVRRVIARLEEQLTSIFQQGGEDEPALNDAAQPILDDARRQIDAIRSNGLPQRETGAQGAGK